MWSSRARNPSWRRNKSSISNAVVNRADQNRKRDVGRFARRRTALPKKHTTAAAHQHSAPTFDSAPTYSGNPATWTVSRISVASGTPVTGSSSASAASPTASGAWTVASTFHSGRRAGRRSGAVFTKLQQIALGVVEVDEPLADAAGVGHLRLGDPLHVAEERDAGVA